MNTDRKLSIASLHVRPNIFSHGFAALTADSATTSLLDDCHDFMFIPSNSTITVAVKFVNKSTESTTPSGINRTIAIELADTKSQEILASTDLRLQMDAMQEEHSEVVTMPVRFYETSARRTFQLVVRNKKTNRIYKTHTINLFYMPAVKRIPMRWFDMLGGNIHETAKPKECGLVAINTDRAKHVTVRIRLHLNHPLLQDIMPELCMRTVTSYGCVHTEYVVPQPDNQGDCGDYVVEQTFMMFCDKSGYAYTEVRCMTYLIGVLPFHMGNTDIEGMLTDTYIIKNPGYTQDDVEKRLCDYISDNCPEKLGQITEDDDDEFDRLLDEFIAGELGDYDDDEEDDVSEEDEDTHSDSEHADTHDGLSELVGLEAVKAKVERYAITARFNKMRMFAGLPEMPLPMHSMFLGSPGTGKTTVAKIIGKRLHEAGVLSKGHVVIKERSTLIGQYYSSEGENTLKALEEAQGGILFIDEAYQLFQPQDPRDPGRFVIETLMTALADESNRDWMLILAGYTKPMKRMFEINPGLSSRIPESNIIMFEDYGEDELMEIARRYFDTNKYNMTEEALARLRTNIANAYASRNETFGNARYVMNLIQTDIIPTMAVRLSKETSPTAEQLSTIVAEDIPLSQINKVETARHIGFR